MLPIAPCKKWVICASATRINIIFGCENQVSLARIKETPGIKMFSVFKAANMCGVLGVLSIWFVWWCFITKHYQCEWMGFAPYLYTITCPAKVVVCCFLFGSSLITVLLDCLPSVNPYLYANKVWKTEETYEETRLNKITSFLFLP